LLGEAPGAPATKSRLSSIRRPSVSSRRAGSPDFWRMATNDPRDSPTSCSSQRSVAFGEPVRGKMASTRWPIVLAWQLSMPMTNSDSLAPGEVKLASSLARRRGRSDPRPCSCPGAGRSGSRSWARRTGADIASDPSDASETGCRGPDRPGGRRPRSRCAGLSFARRSGRSPSPRRTRPAAPGWATADRRRWQSKEAPPEARRRKPAGKGRSRPRARRRRAEAGTPWRPTLSSRRMLLQSSS